MRVVWVGVVVLFLGAGSAWCAAPQWTESTAAELSMTAEAKAPGAPAVVLSYEETENGVSGDTDVHVRIKILTSGGLGAATVEVPQRRSNGQELLESFFARSVRRDGTPVPFAASAANMTMRDGVDTINLPQVEVGSIVEYVSHYVGRVYYDSPYTYYHAPVWILQLPYFMVAGHYRFDVPPDLEVANTRWIAHLPPGMELKREKNRVELRLANVPAMADEAYMPPLESVLYNVRFFYARESSDKYWGETGSRNDSWWSAFDKPTKSLMDAVRRLIADGDDDKTKLRKLYGAVQAFENTDLTRVRTEKEDKKAGAHEVNNSGDIWGRRRGSSKQLTLLFIAMARAAGYRAYPMMVASRGVSKFDQNDLTWDQMDSMVAIVVVGGREIFFDPGTRMCGFAHLAAWHANVMGISTEEKVLKFRMTPVETAAASRMDRAAELTLKADGSVSGTVTLTWAGNAGLLLRQAALAEDERAVRTAIEKDLKAVVPEGVEVTILTVQGLDDGEAPLAVTVGVTGKMGTSTKTRLVLPAEFFASKEKPLLSGETRTQPIEFPAAFTKRDQVSLRLPQGFTIETLPDARRASLMRDSVYGSGAATSDGDMVITTERALVLNRIDYKAEEYAGLHRYFSQVAEYDQDQIVLDAPRGAAGAQ